ncbi:NUDIX hydrolase [Actinoplanes sp. NPDC051633]|uniref:NUDIX hydrolase n=1 Tax=Actinoplanes sp. NPDC051633 TaxID=3155670 RepID=UPI00343E01A9
MVQRAREFTGPPAPTRPAATVVLLREDPGLEVYVLRRLTAMTFGGVYAFPGGGVDPSDQPETIRDDWSRRLGVPDPEARAVVGAAVRELFEEAGVLLAGSPERVVGDVSDWEEDRAAVAGRELTMTALLAKHDLRLRDDLLHPWSRWVTPEFEPRRFDTWFFVARLPQGQTARDVSGEADATQWVSPQGANGLTMLPPTRVTVDSLRSYPDIDSVFQAEQDAAVPVQPRIELTGDGGAVLRISRNGR